MNRAQFKIKSFVTILDNDILENVESVDEDTYQDLVEERNYLSQAIQQNSSSTQNQVVFS